MGINEYIPNHETKKSGVFVNEMNTILKASSIEELHYSVALKSCEMCTEIECDILDVKYPHFLRLKEALELSTPKAYYYGKDLPLFVEYNNCAFMIAPAVESVDDAKKAIEKVIKNLVV